MAMAMALIRKHVPEPYSEAEGFNNPFCGPQLPTGRTCKLGNAEAHTAQMIATGQHGSIYVRGPQ